MERREKIAWMALGRLPHIGAERCRRLVARFGTARQALAASPAAWEEVVGAKVARTARSGPLTWDWAAAQLEAVEARGGRVLVVDEAAYPALLRQIHAPPPLLYVLGQGDPAVPCVGIVGTRKASEYGRNMARRLGRELAQRGYGVVSGMAYGIDTEAHEGALDAGGQTFAVLGCGADVAYPEANAGLHRRLQQRGAVVAEWPLGTQPEPGFFPRRNRLISGLALGIVVVEAAQRSGALITAGYAQEQNREVFAVPGGVFSGRSSGCHALLRDGAKLVEGIEDIVDELEPMLAAPKAPPPEAPSLQAPSLQAKARQLWQRLGTEPCHIDGLLQEGDLSMHEALGILLQLELEGLATQLPGKRFLRRAG